MCAAQESSRERNSLPLADAQIRATGKPGAQQVLVTVGEKFDGGVCSGGTRRGLDLCLRRLDVTSPSAMLPFTVVL